jgi:hypothetical protein
MAKCEKSGGGGEERKGRRTRRRKAAAVASADRSSCEVLDRDLWVFLSQAN